MISKLYKKRIININLNIILASLLAILLSVWPAKIISELTHSMLIILISAYILDASFDLIIFSSLHYIANKRKGYLLDIWRIQKQRVLLAILFFLIATGTDYFLMAHLEIERATSFTYAYIFALIFTRTIHTIYGLKTNLFK